VEVMQAQVEVSLATVPLTRVEAPKQVGVLIVAPVANIRAATVEATQQEEAEDGGEAVVESH